jgi:hypothetical protein
MAGRGYCSDLTAFQKHSDVNEKKKYWKSKVLKGLKNISQNFKNIGKSKILKASKTGFFKLGSFLSSFLVFTDLRQSGVGAGPAEWLGLRGGPLTISPDEGHGHSSVCAQML